MSKPTAEATVKLSLIDRITAPIKRIKARLAALSHGLGFDRIGLAAQNLGKRVIGLGNALGKTTGRLSSFIALLGLGSAGAIAGAYELAKSAADIGSEIDDTSYKLGIGAEALQEYRYAAKMSGIEAEALNKGIEKLGINAISARKGNKGLAADFRALGISLKGPKGAMRSTEEVLHDTFNALAKINDPLRRNQLAFKLFGKSGVSLVQMLMDGTDGLAAFRKEARQTGNVMSARAAKAAADFGDNVDRITERLKGLKLFLGVQLLPVMNELLVTTREWFDANAGLVRTKLAAWAKQFSAALRQLLDPASDIRREIARVADNFGSFIAAIRPVVDFLGGPLQVALMVAAAWIAGPLITAVTLLAASFVNLGIVIMSTPFGWILAGVAAIAASVYVLYQKWDEFVAYWLGMWGRVAAAFDQGFIQGITTLLLELSPVTHVARGMDAVLEYFTGFSLLDAGTSIMKSLANGLLAGGAAVLSFIDGLMMDFQNFGLGLGDKLFEVGGAAIDSFMEGLQSKWYAVVSWLNSSIEGLVGWMPDSVKTRLGFQVEPLPKWVEGGGANRTVVPDSAVRDGGAPSGTSPAASPRSGATQPPTVESPRSVVMPDIVLPAGELGREAGDTFLGGIKAAMQDLMRPIGDLKAQAPGGPAGVARVESMTPIVLPPVSATPQTVTTSTVEAGTVSVDAANFPEPLIAHEPQTVNAPFNVGGVVVNVQGMTPAEAQGMVTRALTSASAQHSANIQSSLSD